MSKTHHIPYVSLCTTGDGESEPYQHLINVSVGDTASRYTPEELTAAVVAEPEKFMGEMLFSSSCDFPDEYGFPEDWDVRELIAKGICDAKKLAYVWLQQDPENGEPRIGVYRSRPEPEPLYTTVELSDQVQADPHTFRRGVIFAESCEHPTFYGFPSYFDVKSKVREWLRYHPPGALDDHGAFEPLIVAAFKALTALNQIRNTTINKEPRVTSYDIASELSHALAAVCQCEPSDLPSVTKYNSWKA